MGRAGVHAGDAGESDADAGAAEAPGGAGADAAAAVHGAERAHRALALHRVGRREARAGVVRLCNRPERDQEPSRGSRARGDGEDDAGNAWDCEVAFTPAPGRSEGPDSYCGFWIAD